MTLHIDILELKNSLISKGIIYVDNGQAGSLVSPKFSSKSFQFKRKPFLVKCAYNDTLVFSICEEVANVKQQTHVGTAKLFAPVFLKNFENELQSLEEDQGFEYEIDAYTPAEQQAGIIRMRIRYDKTEVFMGELAGHKSMKPKNKLKIYKGTCPSKNLFNLLDTEQKGRKFKVFESIYKDDMENMPEF